MSEIRNYTPHVINIVDAAGAPVLDIPPCGIVTRCEERSEPAGEHAGVALSRVVYGPVVDLPAPEDGVLFVVSGLVRAAVPERKDVASPGSLVRGPDNQPRGCKGLVINK